MKQDFSCYDAKLETLYENCICWGFSGEVFGFVGFLKAVPEHVLTQKGHSEFLSEGSVYIGAGQMPSHIKIEGYRLCAALHSSVTGAKRERGENKLTQLLVNPYLPLSTS